MTVMINNLIYLNIGSNAQTIRRPMLRDVQHLGKKVKICQNCVFLATGSRHNEHIQMKFGLSV